MCYKLTIPMQNTQQIITKNKFVTLCFKSN